MKKFHFFLGIYQKPSKISKDICWTSSEPQEAQKSLFWKKNLKMSQTLGPPFSYMRYIEESGRILKQIFVQSIF